VSLLVVTYRARPDLAADNQAHVEAVFAELAESTPDGLRYACLRLADDRFVHLADLTGEANPLLALDTFGRFSATVGARCEPGHEPNAQPARLVGNYRLLG
jgi:hypothetical protein